MTAAMPYFLLSVCCFILVMVAVGLIRVLRGPTNADRMMATQLFGTGGIAALLLLAAAADLSAVADVVLVLALLAAFASVAFVKNASRETDDPEGGHD
jgi:multicomponent Na+:H+ antiporter subunit F